MYLARSSSSVQALGNTVGKTLGSGAYAKLKSAWSPFERQMVRLLFNSVYINLELNFHVSGFHQDN